MLSCAENADNYSRYSAFISNDQHPLTLFFAKKSIKEKIMKKQFHWRVVITLALAFVLGACAAPATPAPATQAPAPTQAAAQPATPVIKDLILATTTSTQDSGLLDVLVPMFEQQTGYVVKTVAVGTGAALQMGQEGNADVLLVHAPASEVPLVQQGYVNDRRLVMHNDFIIVGPSSDPAGIKGTKTAVEAFKKISDSGAPFISRGDDSGTNKMELSLWQTANITPQGNWYSQSGQGMGATLKIASEKQAYTLTDRATYLANKSVLDLDILVQGDTALLNVYHVMVVNPTKFPKVNNAGAVAFADFITSPATQDVIGKFGVDKYGQQLFFPDATKTDAELGVP
jgi:tungstate transport system substrate-binding protein